MIIEIKVPSPGEAVSEAEVGIIIAENGSIVEMDDELLELQTDKASMTVHAEDDGKVEILVQEGDEVKVGDVIARIDTSFKPETSEDEAPAKSAQPTAEEKTAEAPANGGDGYAKGVPSVSASKLMAEKGLTSKDVAGTGRGGRITKADVVQHKEAAPAASNGSPKEEKKAPAPNVAPVMGGTREVTRKRMSLLRRKIGERLLSAKNDTAMLTTFNEVDMYEIMELRKKYKEKFKDHYGIGLGFMSFFTKAATEAMKFFPGINAQIDGEEIVYHDYVDMGVAVSTPRGLVVPVIRNAESMSLAQIESSIREIALKARDNKLTIDEMTGGTFSITNGGVFGSMLSTPILNPPQSAILGMHNIVERPVAINGEVKIRPIMYLALSYDHRIVDGKESVSFLYKMKEFLEDPHRLLLGI